MNCLRRSTKWVSFPQICVHLRPVLVALQPRIAILCAVSFVLAGLGSGELGAQEEFTNDDCLECHTAEPEAVPGKPGELEFEGVRPEYFDESVHYLLDCIDCHTGIKDLDHDVPLQPAQCVSCHESTVTEYSRSIHSVSHELGESGAATCADCHGTHEMVEVDRFESPVHKFNLPKTCARCHENPGLTEEYQMHYPEAASHYAESIHGRSLLEMGLIVAPSCNDCHGVHDTKRSVDRDSTTNHANIAKTCGQCHVGVEDIYNESVHGVLLAEGDPDGPVCTDCHTAHDIETPTNAHFKAVSDERCGECHEDRLTFYHDTYHGKAMALGRPNVASEVAACYDCHGHHDVFEVSDPRSRLSEERIVDTCSQCHPGVNLAFTQYQPHANPLDAENYPELHAVFLFMTALVVGVFVFFGIHTLFWLARSVYIYLHDSKSFREAKVAAEEDEEQFTRFNPFERFLHLLMVISFLMLVITGMPLKFYYTDWAKVMFDLMGGPEVARWLHHFWAVMTAAYFILHLSDLAISFWRNRSTLRDPDSGRIQFRRFFQAAFGPDSMVPSIQDWRDFIGHLKWFVGKGPRPQFDRWTYWEKFDYFAVFWGIFIIGFSGLILWFPKFFTLFMPGWVINIAMVVHSDEALLAAGFIFTFHFFNTHFRLEKFPMDKVIFSGRVSKTEMLHERRRWYDRLVAKGTLDAHRVKDDWHHRKNIMRSFGFIFLGVGLLLLVQIIYAMLSRLGH